MDVKPILKEIQDKNFKPVYFLHGEEPYFIDVISNAIIENALEEHERDFNQTILYGKDTEILSLLSELKSYPMMSERRLVVLKEAQDFRAIDELEKYTEDPTSTTIFVVCYKYKTFDARKKTLKNVTKTGKVIKSEKIREYQLAEWLQRYVKSIGYDITSKASMLLVEFIGNDLSRMVKELEKLTILIEKGTTINEVHIEENIGISKDYNVFEFSNAITSRDVAKAFRIVQYFEYNPKATDITVVIGNLFRVFSQIMRVHFMPNKAQDVVAQALGVHPFVAGEIIKQRQLFDPKKVAANIATLHEYDLKAKGVGNSSASQADLMRELTYRLIY